MDEANRSLNIKPFLIVASVAKGGRGELLENLRSLNLVAEVSVCDIASCLSRLPKEQDVVLVSDQISALEKYSDRLGLLAVLLSEGNFDLSVQRNWLQVNRIDLLEPLFDGSLPIALLLLRLDIDGVRKAQKAVAIDFRDAVLRAGGIHVFGAGTIGHQVLHECSKSGISVLGFLDNNPKRQGGWQDRLPIRDPVELDREEQVVVVAVGHHAEAITQQLHGLGFRYIFNLSQFFYALSAEGQPETGYLDDVFENRLHWIVLALRLQDTCSRRVLNAVLRHRLTLETKYLATVKDVSATQWLAPEFITPSQQAVFVDGGAFDGDTAEAFRKFNGPAKRIHAFELDPEIAARAALRLAGFPEVLVHSQGLSDCTARIGFVGSGITDGRIDGTNNSERHAEVVSIDGTVSEAITYLKLDVEGAESMAIAGAERQIQVNSPVIGFAVYHKPSDPWLLTTQLLSLNKRYRYYMRHYTDVAFETVIYAIPAGSIQN